MTSDAGFSHGRLARRIQRGEFAVTCELSPPRGATLEPLRRKAEQIHDWVDAATVTDGQGAQTRLSSWAGSIAVMRADVEPIMLLQCRDRNRLGLQADLLGAAGVGIPNVVLQTGDTAVHGDQPGALDVFDLDSLAAIRAAQGLKEKHMLSGRELPAAPEWLIGCVEDGTPADLHRVDRLAAKIEAGAQFVETQYVFDLQRFRRWMQAVRDRGLDRRCAILVGVGPITSVNGLAFLESLDDIYLPDEVKRRLHEVPEGQLTQAGVDLCVETIRVIREEPGVAGIYLLASNREQLIPQILEASGIGKRPPLV